MSDEAVGKKFKIPFKIWGPVVLALVLVGAGAGGAAYLIKAKPEILGLSKGQAAAQAEVDSLVAEVSKLIALPSDEKPTVATITDIEKLKDQAFFKSAANNDRVLIYTNAKKAILYRPSEKRIIDVGAVNINQQSGQAAGASTATPVKVALYNGTETVGVTNEVEKIVKEKVTSIEVVAKGNAAKRDYQKTMVVDLTGSRNADAQALAQALGAEVKDLPEGEQKPAGADFLVIVGSDQVK